MHPEDIKAELSKRGSSQSNIARRLNVAITSVHNVIHGACKSERIAREVARIVGIDRSELWPGRYKTPEERAASTQYQSQPKPTYSTPVSPSKIQIRKRFRIWLKCRKSSGWYSKEA